MLKNDPNKILVNVLTKSIKNSKDWNWTFDLLSDDPQKIDKSEWMIIGLHTDWGGWKTTLIEDLEINLWTKEKDSRYFFQTINAWEFNKENKEDLWMSIISYFYLKLIEENIEEIKEKEHFKILLSKLSLLNFVKLSNLTLGLFTGIETKFLEKFTEELKDSDPKNKLESIKSNISLFYWMKEDIKKILWYREIKEKYDKYVLVIDDLDRCTPKEVINLLDSLKIFLDLPNVIVIVAVDRRHIEKWVFEVYNKKNKEQYLVNPDEYLEKIIHLPIDLFLFDDDIKNINLELKNKKNNISIITDKKIQKVINESKEILEIIKFWLSNNPRKVWRFIRLFKFYYNVFNNLWFFKEKEYLNEKFLTFWLILKLEWWDYFKEIIKTPILLSYLDTSVQFNINDVLIKYSGVFYEKEKKELHDKKFKDITIFNLLNSYNKNKLKKFTLFLEYFNNLDSTINISVYFSWYILWSKDYLIDKNLKNEKELLKPLISLSLFDEFNFKNDYITIVQKLYEEWKMNDNFDSNSYLSSFEIEKIKLLLWENNIKKDFLLKEYLDENNINLFNYWLREQWETILWLIKYKEGKEADEKRFLLWSKLFFNYIIKNFALFYNIKIKDWENYIITFKELSKLGESFYEKLWENHILNYLENWSKRTMFWELINQMSHAKIWPSIWWMAWATDFIQLENIVISNIENAIDNKKNNVNEWKKIIEKTLIIKENINIAQQLENYKEMINFVESINNEAKDKVKRLKKRLIYIFSHIWALQDIENFPVYYSKSREWLANLWIWSYNYWDIDDAIKSYITFSESYNKLVNELKNNNKLVNKLNLKKYTETLNNEFQLSLWNIDVEYIEKYFNYKIVQDLLYNTWDNEEVDVLDNQEVDAWISEKLIEKNKVTKDIRKYIQIWDIWMFSKSEDLKRRPYLVLKRVWLKYIVVWLTSKEPRNKTFSYELNLSFLNKVSFVNLYLLETVQEDYFRIKLWKINNEDFKLIIDRYNHIK